MHQTDWAALRSAAHDAASRCYAPYSGFAVGAAVRANDGMIFTGANIENRSYGLALCAERAAIATAVQEREDDIDPALIIEAVLAVDREGEVLAPCGACRQVILEFGRHASVWLPSGPCQIDVALAEPFELPDGASKRDYSPAPIRPGIVQANRRVLGLIELPRDDRTLLLRQIVTLREQVSSLYSGIDYGKTRAILFAALQDSLEVAPGFFSNFDQNIEERMLHIPVGYGITGGAFATKKANFGVPCTPKLLAGHELPATEQAKVDPQLRWVVSWPLRFGVVCLDGYEDVNTDAMANIAEAPQLLQIVTLIDRITRKL